MRQTHTYTHAHKQTHTRTHAHTHTHTHTHTQHARTHSHNTHTHTRLCREFHHTTVSKTKHLDNLKGHTLTRITLSSPKHSPVHLSTFKSASFRGGITKPQNLGAILGQISKPQIFAHLRIRYQPPSLSFLSRGIMPARQGTQLPTQTMHCGVVEGHLGETN